MLAPNINKEKFKINNSDKRAGPFGPPRLQDMTITEPAIEEKNSKLFSFVMFVGISESVLYKQTTNFGNIKYIEEDLAFPNF